MMYDYLDRVLKKVVLQIYRLFKKYRKLSYDELNVTGEVQELYRELEAINQTAFQQIAAYYYKQESKVKNVLQSEWLAKVLRTPSQVMKYSYDSEVVRKRDRLMEALIATGGLVTEYDTAMRYWTQMTGWFAVEVADAATTQAREDSGIETVMWVSEHDNKVCDRCWKLNGQVFHAQAVPPKPHPRCRCYTIDL
jgi:SPP1 gp7 family putative phage head morphogenesis protein